MTAKNVIEIDNLAHKLVQLIDIFRGGGVSGDFHWWQGMGNLFLPAYGYQKGQPLFEDVVNSVIQLNPDMLSELRKYYYKNVVFK